MDSGFLTLLQTFDYPGLEIQVNGEWLAVPPVVDAIVVNLGEQMTEMSNGLFKSTVHRVVDIGRDRFSIPFFYEPGCDTNINVKVPRALLPPGSEAEFPEKTDYLPFAAFLLNKLPIYAEYSGINDNLPKEVREKYLKKWAPKKCWATENGVKTDR